MTLALAQVFHAFNARSPVRSAFTARLFTNGWLWGAVAVCVLLQVATVYGPFLRAVLQTTPLTGADWGGGAGLRPGPGRRGRAGPAAPTPPPVNRPPKAPSAVVTAAIRSAARIAR